LMKGFYELNIFYGNYNKMPLGRMKVQGAGCPFYNVHTDFL